MDKNQEPSEKEKDISESTLCICGHHENDHTLEDRSYCDGGLSESCSCRHFQESPLTREISPTEEQGIFDRFTDYRSVPPLRAVSIERAWQDGKFGPGRDLPDDTWLRILVEEVGEAAQSIEIIQSDPKMCQAALENLEVEAIQIAAVAVAWVEALRRRNP